EWEVTRDAKEYLIVGTRSIVFVVLMYRTEVIENIPALPWIPLIPSSKLIGSDGSGFYLYKIIVAAGKDIDRELHDQCDGERNYARDHRVVHGRSANRTGSRPDQFHCVLSVFRIAGILFKQRNRQSKVLCLPPVAPSPAGSSRSGSRVAIIKIDVPVMLIRQRMSGCRVVARRISDGGDHIDFIRPGQMIFVGLRTAPEAFIPKRVAWRFLVWMPCTRRRMNRVDEFWLMQSIFRLLRQRNWFSF